MTSDELRVDVRGFIISNFLYDDHADLRDDVSLFDSGTLDSTRVLELITHLESSCDLVFADEELVASNFDSVDHIVGFLGSKLG